MTTVATILAAFTWLPDWFTYAFLAAVVVVMYGANPLARYLHRTNPTRLAAEALDERDLDGNVAAFDAMGARAR